MTLPTPAALGSSLRSKNLFCGVLFRLFCIHHIHHIHVQYVLVLQKLSFVQTHSNTKSEFPDEYPFREASVLSEKKTYMDDQTEIKYAFLNLKGLVWTYSWTILSHLSP